MTRRRCSCRKRTFPDELAARLALARIDQTIKSRGRTPARRHSEQEIRAYRCPAGSGWHLTHHEPP